jgi:hypothetical protein
MAIFIRLKPYHEHILAVTFFIENISEPSGHVPVGFASFDDGKFKRIAHVSFILPRVLKALTALALLLAALFRHMGKAQVMDALVGNFLRDLGLVTVLDGIELSFLEPQP